MAHVRISAFFFLFSVIIGFSICEEPSEHIVDLTADNFEAKTSEPLFAINLFFAPWCGHCKQLMPIFENFCKLVKEKTPEVLCSRLNCDENKELCAKHEIKGYPSLIRFIGKKSCTYAGDREIDSLLSWYDRTLKVLKGVSDDLVLDKYVGENSDLLVLGYFKEPLSRLEELLIDATCDPGKNDFVLVRNYDLVSKFDIEDSDGIYIVKNGKQHMKFKGADDNLNDIGRFLFTSTTDLVPEYSMSNSDIIFSSYLSKYATLIFDPNDASSSEILQAVQKIASDYVGTVRFFKTCTNQSESEKVIDYFKVKKFPFICFYDDESGSFYHYDKADFAEESIKEFVQGCLDGKTEAFRMKQQEPEDWDKTPVKTLVADNFESAKKLKKNMFVLFYAPWCTHCKAVKPVWEKLGIHFENDPDVLIGQMDATENDMPSVKIEGYPTIKVFKENGEVADYRGERTFEALKDFVSSGFGATKDEKQPEPDTVHEDL